MCVQGGSAVEGHGAKLRAGYRVAVAAEGDGGPHCRGGRSLLRCYGRTRDDESCEAPRA